jgi:hypothetical protein
MTAHRKWAALVCTLLVLCTTAVRVLGADAKVALLFTSLHSVLPAAFLA